MPRRSRACWARASRISAYEGTTNPVAVLPNVRPRNVYAIPRRGYAAPPLRAGEARERLLVAALSEQRGGEPERARPRVEAEAAHVDDSADAGGAPDDLGDDDLDGELVVSRAEGLLQVRHADRRVPEALALVDVAAQPRGVGDVVPVEGAPVGRGDEQPRRDLDEVALVVDVRLTGGLVEHGLAGVPDGRRRVGHDARLFAGLPIGSAQRGHGPLGAGALGAVVLLVEVVLVDKQRPLLEVVDARGDAVDVDEEDATVAGSCAIEIAPRLPAVAVVAPEGDDDVATGPGHDFASAAGFFCISAACCSTPPMRRSMRARSSCVAPVALAATRPHAEAMASAGFCPMFLKDSMICLMRFTRDRIACRATARPAPRRAPLRRPCPRARRTRRR